MPKYVIGVDFGTESGRALLVDVANGQEVATAISIYRHGVITERLPGAGITLPRDWALQDPNDYIEVLSSTIPAILRESKAAPSDVIGLGIDFTSCTMLPTTADGTPLVNLPQWRNEPHAWVKLWKHHAAQSQANRLNQTAQDLGYKFLDRYGGKISSEWFFPKAWQILEEAPQVYMAAGRLIEAGDWIVWQLTGVERRSASIAGFKALWSVQDGFPPDAFFKTLDSRLEEIVATKMTHTILPVGAKAGGLTEQSAQLTGLRAGTAVAVANVDAHASVPGATVTGPGTLVISMGTSNCHMVLDAQEVFVPGICGAVSGGFVPGLVGYEAGQASVGDGFAWFVDYYSSPALTEEARLQGKSLHQLLEEKASRLKPGESGLLALDWWNGNRSVLIDADLSGLLLGFTLTTKPEEIYRALLEATAYGTRQIIDAFEKAGIPIKEVIVTGGLPLQNKLMLQIYADITGRQLRIAQSQQAVALGAAIYGAVAAGPDQGGYASLEEATASMARLRQEVYSPLETNRAIYEALYSEYLTLHDYFGRGRNDVMKRLKALQR